ncbi:hypothetical protein [Dishui Lake large algae virus 1]|nr:hypothetical protein [Dishui Lake large algae virus 1]
MTAGNRKILAVLYVLLRKQGKKPRFLVVKDAEERDWTFISGTCEEREPVEKCAIREIREETRGMISLKKLPARTRRFQTYYNDNRVDVMFIPLRLTEQDMKMIVEEFPHIETHGRPELEENTEMRFETLGQFMRRKNIWDFVRNVCSMDSFVENCPK